MSQIIKQEKFNSLIVSEAVRKVSGGFSLFPKYEIVWRLDDGREITSKEALHYPIFERYFEVFSFEGRRYAIPRKNFKQ